MDIYKFSNQ